MLFLHVGAAFNAQKLWAKNCDWGGGGVGFATNIVTSSTELTKEFVWLSGVLNTTESKSNQQTSMKSKFYANPLRA
jgi:hypothetical protein